MSNVIELEFKQNANGAYDVVSRSGLAGQKEDTILVTAIPCFDPAQYLAYQEAYWQLYPQARLGVKEVIVQTQDDLNRIKQQLDDSAANVLQMLNDCAGSPQLAEIKKEIESRSENLRVIISTECEELRKLPFHKWSLFPNGTEVIFSGVESRVLERTRHPDQIRILVILGDTTGIDIEKDKRTIEEYCKTDAQIVFLPQTSEETLTKEELTAKLADPQGWDIIFFSGHSGAGKISINPAEHLTMKELKDVLKPAISKRVQIFIFNSCDGLKLAPDLEKLNIDRLIVMRELIPDKIAQEFLKSFLKAFTGGARFDDAVKSARQYLDLDNFQAEYPYASWLPIVIQNRLVASPTWQSLGKIRSPYKGLEAFTEADAGNFYGREETIERYAKLVATAPLVPIIGASGSGKSSLVQAGLIPYLKQDTASDWQILTMRPGRNPFDALAKAIFNAEQADLQTIELDVDLASDRHLLTQKLAQMRIPHRRILLFIDQFEELFTQSDNDATRQVFLQSLADAVSNVPNFVLVFTLRNDFLLTLQSDRQDKDFTGMLGRFGFQSFDGRMTDEQFKAAITKPVEKLGVEFEDRLVDRLMKDVGTADGSLPLLQLVLDLLWKNVQKRQLTHECYEAIGGKDGMKTVLVKLADDVYNGFAEDGKVKEFKQVFLRLVKLGNRSDTHTRRIATRQEIGEVNWQTIVMPLSVARMLKTDLNEQGEEIVEVIHETLIQSWQRLEIWIEQCRQELERIAQIEETAIKWHETKRSKHDLWGGKKLKDAQKFAKDPNRVIPFSQIVNDFLEASSKEQRWITTGIFVVLGMIVPGLALVAGNQSRQAQLNEADALGNSAISLVDRGQNLDGLLKAIKAGRIMQAQRASNPTVTSTLQKTLNYRNERNRLEGHQNSVRSISFSPDGKTLASGSADKTIKLWELATGKEIKTLSGHQGGVNSVSFSPDGKTLASASGDKTIKLWELATGKEIKTLSGHQEYVNSVSFSPDGKTLASASRDNTIKLWELATGKEIQTLSGHQNSVNSVSFSPDGKTLASGSIDKIKLWDLATGKEIKTFSGNQIFVKSVSFSPDGKTLASASGDKTIKLWEVGTGKKIKTLSGHQEGVNSVSFSPDGKTLASASEDKTIKLWELATGIEIQTLSVHQGYVRSVSFSPDGKTLASASMDKTIKLWELATGIEIKTLSSHQYGVNSVSFSPDGKTLASASEDKTIKLWEVGTGKEIQTLSGHQDGVVNSVSFSPDGKTLASASSDTTIKLWWDLATGKEIQTLLGHQEGVNSVSFSPDGKTLASASGDKTIKLWEVGTGIEIKTLSGHQGGVNSVSFSPDGKTLASASGDKTIKLWELATGIEIKTLSGHQEYVRSVSFSPDGKTLASASEGKTIKLWELATGKEIQTLSGHQEYVRSVSFSPDGKTLASASEDKTIKLWEVATGKEIQTLSSHQKSVNSVSFSPDGKILASSSTDETIKLWSRTNWDFDALIGRSCDWARAYLEHNINVSQSDKHLCDGIGTKKQ
jgi:WD40 repeat protein